MRPALFGSLACLLLCSALAQAEAPDAGSLYFQAESLIWWFKPSPEPAPLVTSASFSGGLPGILGEPGTQVALGGQAISAGQYWGSRFTVGYVVDEEGALALEGNYLFLPGQTSQQTVTTSGLPGARNLGVPIFDVSGFTSGGRPGESVFVLPGPVPNGGALVPGFAGRFDLILTSRLQGSELNGVFNLSDQDEEEEGTLRWSGLAGLRWAQLNEALDFQVQTAGLPTAPTGIAGQFFNSRDTFNTRDNFFGAQLGTRVKYRAGPFFAQANAKVALGDMHESVTISGDSVTSSGTLFFPSGGFASLPNGIFSQPSNLGSHTRNRFAAVTEASLSTGYQVTSFARVVVGYNLLYFSNVVRPGNQLNRNLNTTTTGQADLARASGATVSITGAAAPAFNFHDSGFWAQGINLSLEFRH